jgi:hypothetical protein
MVVRSSQERMKMDCYSWIVEEVENLKVEGDEDKDM